MKPLCIYHGGCDDGFAAAWCVRKGLGNDVEFYPGVYQKEPPPHDNREVIFVDFSYKRPVLDAMAQRAAGVLILDHHKTAQEDLADLPEPRATYEAHPPMAALFDMNRSGAGMAWDYFVGGPRPDFIEYVQDRDLWRRALPGGDEFTIALRSYPQDFDIWDKLIDRGAQSLIAEGGAIQRYYRLRVEELKRSAYKARFSYFNQDGNVIEHTAWVSNAPYFAASEVAGELSAETGMGACYFEVEKGRWQYSLRSRGDVDVSALARVYGGGGHKAAAGFSSDKPVHKAV